MEKLSYLTGVSKDRAIRIIESRSNPIRLTLKNGSNKDISQQESNIVNALHAIVEIYTSADFSKLNEEDAKFTLMEMKNFIIEHFSMLSINELREAFSLAASGKIKADLRAWNGKFTIVMLGDVLTAYLKFSTNLIFEYDKQKTLLIQQNKEEQKEAKNEEAKSQVIREYLEAKSFYKENLEFNLNEMKSYLHWGKILVSAGYINFDDSERLALYKEAEQMVRNDISRQLTEEQRPSKRRELRTLIEALNSDDKETPKSFKQKVNAKYSILAIKKSIINSIQ